MVNSGEVDETVIDDKVRRILQVMFKTPALGNASGGALNAPEHQEIARKVAEEAVVLLKNENNLLPLSREEIKTLAVIGHNANRKFAERGGSSQVKALYEITVLEGIQKLVGDGVEVVFAEGYQPNEKNQADGALASEAIAVAENADAVIYVGGWIHGLDGMPWGKGTYDAEALDKQDIKLLFGQEALINSIAAANPNTAVVLMGGSNVEMNNWLGNVPSVLQAWYTGMEGGNAIANILFGEVNPSGKLPMTFANSHMDYPSHKVGEYPGENGR
ncbi:MAG TPA: glycosyl hydrolase, partial [Cytophagales bacterium]|nr:glycosyl hydrolase [Cytophagales bacterium]